MRDFVGEEQVGRGDWLDVFSVCVDVEDHTIHSVDADVACEPIIIQINIH